MDKRKLKKFWRRFGAFVILALMCLSEAYCPKAMGFAFLLFLTVPCGIKIFNRGNLWIVRQTVFAITGLANILAANHLL